MTETCDYSDLPTNACNHCHPEHRPSDLGKAIDAIKARRPMHIAHPVAHQATVDDDHAHKILSKAARALDRGQPATTTDYVDALTRTTTHYEPRTVLQTNPDGTNTWVSDRHRTISLPLLEQLGSAVAQSGSAEGGRRSFESKPSARLEAIDVLQDIETEALAWNRRLNLPVMDPKTGHQLPLDQLVQAAAANAGDDMLRDLRSWWIRARTVTGWDAPVWKPNRNTCPLCEVKGDLRVRLDAQTAVCLACGEAWDTATIGLLADHIRAENDDAEVPRTVRDTA